MSGSFLEEFAVGFTISLVWLTIHVLSTYRRGNTSERLVAISMIFSVAALYLLTYVPHESISSSLKSLIYFLALTPLVAAPFLLRITVSQSNEFDLIALQDADSASDSE
tara:strand:- start:1215 stop:1541 length:327 start_codon:yes stop_codon:yes gene_type:complete